MKDKYDDNIEERLHFLKRLLRHMMIKLDTTHESFVGGWHIDEKICDDLIQLFKDNKEHQKKAYQVDF